MLILKFHQRLYLYTIGPKCLVNDRHHAGNNSGASFSSAVTPDPSLLEHLLHVNEPKFLVARTLKLAQSVEFLRGN
jgi:hypothetical protein